MRKLNVRDLLASDLKYVLQIHNGKFQFPDLSNLLYIKSKVVEAEGKIVATGFVRLTSEGILIVDENAPRTIRARAVVALVGNLIKDTHEMGMDECHVFVQNESIKSLLRKLGFVDCKGEPMVVTYG